MILVVGIKNLWQRHILIKIIQRNIGFAVCGTAIPLGIVIGLAQKCNSSHQRWRVILRRSTFAEWIKSGGSLAQDVEIFAGIVRRYQYTRTAHNAILQMRQYRTKSRFAPLFGGFGVVFKQQIRLCFGVYGFVPMISSGFFRQKLRLKAIIIVFVFGLLSFGLHHSIITYQFNKRGINNFSGAVDFYITFRHDAINRNVFYFSVFYQ